MTETLALRYRPARFEDLVGQPAVQVILRQMIKVGQIPTALLFTGSRGTGKTTTARIFAAALNCHTEHKPCGNCPSCKAIFDGSSMDVIEIDAASNGLVDDIRNLRHQVLYRQTGDYRIVILDEAQSMSPAAFNALLKTLEEPPPRTVFLLLTTEPNKILTTVASRCMPFTFKRLTIADITTRLTQIAITENIPAEPELLQLIADRADGAMRDAIMLLDQVGRIGLRTVDQYHRLIGHTDHAAPILNALANADLPTAFTTLDNALTAVADPMNIISDMISTLRDVLVLRNDSPITKTGTALAARQNLALSLDTPTVVAALTKALWPLTTKRSIDARSTLELAVVMLHEIFHPPGTTPPAPTRITLTEMSTFQ